MMPYILVWHRSLSPLNLLCNSGQVLSGCASRGVARRVREGGAFKSLCKAVCMSAYEFYVGGTPCCHVQRPKHPCTRAHTHTHTHTHSPAPPPSQSLLHSQTLLTDTHNTRGEKVSLVSTSPSCNWIFLNFDRPILNGLLSDTRHIKAL